MDSESDIVNANLREFSNSICAE